jgi:hypothetical protein
VNDLENVVASRLHSLAEELAREIDVVGQVREGRARFRRRRRQRTGVALAAVAVGALVVGLPPAIGALSSSQDPARDAARPSPTTAAAPADTDREDSAQARAEQALRNARLHSLAEELRATLQARTVPLSLGAPVATGNCPERAPTVNSAFGAALAEHSSGAAEGDCLWRTPEGDLQVALGFMAGGTIDQIHADVDAETAGAGCYPTALPGSLTFTALALCEEEGGTGWHLRVMDATGTGFWLISVTVGDRSPEDPASTVAAVLDAADADL